MLFSWCRAELSREGMAGGQQAFVGGDVIGHGLEEFGETMRGFLLLREGHEWQHGDADGEEEAAMGIQRTECLMLDPQPGIGERGARMQTRKGQRGMVVQRVDRRQAPVPTLPNDAGLDAREEGADLCAEILVHRRHGGVDGLDRKAKLLMQIPGRREADATSNEAMESIRRWLQEKEIRLPGLPEFDAVIQD